VNSTHKPKENDMVCPMLFAPCAFSMFPGMIDADVESVQTKIFTGGKKMGEQELIEKNVTLTI